MRRGAPSCALLFEVEEALRHHKQVLDLLAFLVPCNDRHAIAIAAVPRHDLRPTVSDLRAFARPCLTASSLPVTVVWMDALPVAVDGRRLSRSQLPRALASELQHVADNGAQVSTAEKLEQLRALWREVLSLTVAELSDDMPFGAYGGDSISASRLITLAQAQGLDLPHSLLYSLERVTLAQLIGFVDGRSHASEAPSAPSAAARIIERDGRRPTAPLRPLGGLSACASGDLSGVRRLVDSGWCAAHAVDKHGNTALQWAAGGGHLLIVRWLLEEQSVPVDAVNKVGRTALMWACKSGAAAVCAYLLNTAGADVALRMKVPAPLHAPHLSPDEV